MATRRLLAGTYGEKLGHVNGKGQGLYAYNLQIRRDGSGKLVATLSNATGEGKNSFNYMVIEVCKFCVNKIVSSIFFIFAGKLLYSILFCLTLIGLFIMCLLPNHSQFEYRSRRTNCGTRLLLKPNRPGWLRGKGICCR